MRVFVLLMGFFCALSIAFGRVFFGILGTNTFWYAVGLALPYILGTILLVWRIGVVLRADRRPTRALWGFAAVSWVCAVAFAVTVPDVQQDGSLAAIVAPPGASAFALEMSVALCNPFIILAFLFLGCAVAVAVVNARERIAEQD